MDSSKLEELRRFGSSKMSEKRLPQCILYMKDSCSPRFDIHFDQKSFASVDSCQCRFVCLSQDIPKGSTGKPARIGLAKRMKLETLDIHKTQAYACNACVAH
jgi:hypothetical protein